MGHFYHVPCVIYIFELTKSSHILCTVKNREKCMQQHENSFSVVWLVGFCLWFCSSVKTNHIVSKLMHCFHGSLFHLTANFVCIVTGRFQLMVSFPIPLTWSLSLYPTGELPSPVPNKNSSGDEIANNFLWRHRTCRGQCLCPLNWLPNFYYN